MGDRARARTGSRASRKSAGQDQTGAQTHLHLKALIPATLLACASCSLAPPAVDSHAGGYEAWELRARRIYAAFPSFEAAYRGSWAPEGGNERSLRLWVAAEGASRLRLEIAGRLGGSWLSIVVDGEEMLAVSPRAGEYLRAPAAAGRLREITGWPLAPEQVAGVLLGDISARLPSSPRPPEVEAVYEIWQVREGVAIPARLRLRAEGGELILNLEEIEVRRPAPAAFDLTPPPGLRPATVRSGAALPPVWGIPAEPR